MLISTNTETHNFPSSALTRRFLLLFALPGSPDGVAAAVVVVVVVVVVADDDDGVPATAVGCDDVAAASDSDMSSSLYSLSSASDASSWSLMPVADAADGEAGYAAVAAAAAAAAADGYIAEGASDDAVDPDDVEGGDVAELSCAGAEAEEAAEEEDGNEEVLSVVAAAGAERVAELDEFDDEAEAGVDGAGVWSLLKKKSV